jgi:hypothetical protein
VVLAAVRQLLLLDERQLIYVGACGYASSSRVLERQYLQQSPARLLAERQSARHQLIVRLEW